MAGLRAAVTKPALRPSTPGKTGKVKTKRRKDDNADTSHDTAAHPGAGSDAGSGVRQTTWGFLEPLRPILALLSDAIGPIARTPVMVLLAVLLTWLWMRPSAQPGLAPMGMPGLTTPARLAAYEDMWRGQESELWGWLEERVGAPVGGEKTNRRDDAKRKEADRLLARKTQDEGLTDKQIREAIRVTEERLAALKEAVQKRRDSGDSPEES